MRTIRCLPVLLVLLATACAQPVTGTPVAGEAPVERETTSSEPTSPSERQPSERNQPSEGPLAPLVGKWTGEYTCNQGETGLTMTVEAVTSGTVQVLVEFFPLPENPNAKPGSFRAIGSEASGKVVVRQQEWVQQPEGYFMVDFEVTSPLEDGVEVVSGNVLAEGCRGFSVRRG